MMTSAAERASRASSVASSSTPADPSAATASLQLLLREDPLLVEYGLTDATRSSEDVAFRYAATLLQGNSSSSEEDGSDRTTTAAQAASALQDVERKLALVESLAVKLSRTSPEAVAGPFLRWHGYEILPVTTDNDGSNDKTAATLVTTSRAASTGTLQAVRERAARLERQAEVLETVARRVEGSLQRGLDKLSLSCVRLERVLQLSQTLKRLLRFQFEWRKLETYDLEDTRDLTRAAASVAILEDLLAQPEWQTAHKIARLASLRPQAEGTAAAVREAAGRLLQASFGTEESASSTLATPYLPATLQVYFSLQELPQAVWQAVDQAHAQAEVVSRQLWSSARLQQLQDQAKKQAKESRAIPKKLQQLRAEAAQDWAAQVTQAALQVQQLQRVLSYKTDPTTRQGFLQVVAQAPVPSSYLSREEEHNGGSLVFSLFSLFWQRYCRTLATILEGILASNAADVAEVAALYPAIRGVAKTMIGRFQEVAVTTSSSSTAVVDEGTPVKTGILGGSQALAADMWGPPAGDNPQAAPDAWTRGDISLVGLHTTTTSSSLGPAALTAVFSSAEWNDLMGTVHTQAGLYRLQEAFVKACTTRLCEPLQYLFPEDISLDDNGVPMSSGALSMLPSKYDIQRFDENIRQELSLADPREGGGDLTSVTMIAACVVDMMIEFCQRAQQALSGSNNYITADFVMTDSLQHDRKLAVILYTISTYLKSAPEKTFVAPYRPASLLAHEEAAILCAGALQPALTTIDNMVQTSILHKLSRSLNQRLLQILAKMHLGVYLGRSEEEPASFCQKQISPALETMSDRILARFPPPFATHLAATVASFVIYTFCSNLALIRPLGETSRLHITQDLADLEMALEQFVSKAGATSLSQVGKGKPYAELRAVRQMLFWNGLSSTAKSANDLSRLLLREAWIRNLRPSTVIHYLFSYAPTLLTSPHHADRIKAEVYAQKLISWEGLPSHDGDETAWHKTLACCDAYQQRSGTASATADGDARIAALLLALGPELLRRRRK
jgi:hypothetical protein